MGSCDPASGQHARYVPGQARSRPMEALSLGMMRTGTASMAAALEILGISHSAHGLEQLDQPEYVDRWWQAAKAKYKGQGLEFKTADWDELLGHCSAVTDMPCIMFWRELCEAYPDAKVILVERDEDAWYRSFDDAVIESLFSTSGKILRNVIMPLLRRPPLTETLVCEMFESSTAAGVRSNARRIYQQHYADIRKAVPPERLLEYRLLDGWGPLCKFLGMPVPDTDFPRVNETAELLEKVRQFRVKTTKQLRQVLFWRLLPLVAVGIAVTVGWRSVGIRSWVSGHGGR